MNCNSPTPNQPRGTTEPATAARAGFTAWETVVIVALLIALAFLLMRMWLGGSAGDQRRLTLDRLATSEDALAKYAIDNAGVFPTTEQGLAALLQKPSKPPQPRDWRGPYLARAEMLRDAWGRKFLYVQPGPGSPPRPYDLWSLGADGAEGGQGPKADILSWDRTTQLP